MLFRSLLVCPRYPENLQKLFALAQNLWCTWNYDAIGLFYRIDTDRFRESGHNPMKLLHRLPKARIEELSADRGFLFELEKVWERFTDYMRYGDALEQQLRERFGGSDVIAYFSMEYGLHECVPIYAGGLGVLAGDFMKGASDMGVPVVGIGLLYKYGYFTQKIGPDGRQREVFVEFENHLLPITEQHGRDGEKTFVRVRIKDEQVKVKLWRIDVGRAQLVLLDTDIDENPAGLRDITNELYVGDREKRLQQELVLGLGGLEALELLGYRPKVYHLNEGHSAFFIIGRLKRLIQRQGYTFSQAKEVIRSSTVFTTHTPVIAGNENFDAELVGKYLEGELEDSRMSFKELAKAGSVEGTGDIFWLPPFAMRFSRYINAVSRQHQQVSKRMWMRVFAEQPAVSIPIECVTNGVHRSWLSEQFTDLLNRYVGPEGVCRDKDGEVWQRVLQIPDEEIWHAHRRNKQDMVNFVRRMPGSGLSGRSILSRKAGKTGRALNPEYLTVVFARRIASYKRPTLLLRDAERLVKILTNSQRPVQVIFAGKAHPADEESKEMARKIVNFAREAGVEGRFVFLENYDLSVARHLIWGADVWLNTPAREMEASGSSGMKAAMNGVLQLSTNEGWWREAYNGGNGWVVDAGPYVEGELQDAVEASQIYELLEGEIGELYYERNDAGVPEGWTGMMKQSVYSVCRGFNMNRVLSEYVEKMYLPAKERYERVVEKDGQALKEFAEAEANVLKYWDGVQVREFTTSVDRQEHATEGEEVEARCSVYVGRAPAELFSVELFYVYDENGRYRTIPMKASRTGDDVVEYRCEFQIEGYGLQNVNVRVRPANELVADAHAELIKWKE